MIPAENYLPEWKLYLLKKLALGSKKLSDRPLTTREFLYVTDQEVRNATEESLNQKMRFIQGIPIGFTREKKYRKRQILLRSARGTRLPSLNL